MCEKRIFVVGEDGAGAVERSGEYRCSEDEICLFFNEFL